MHLLLALLTFAVFGLIPGIASVLDWDLRRREIKADLERRWWIRHQDVLFKLDEEFPAAKAMDRVPD